MTNDVIFSTFFFGSSYFHLCPLIIALFISFQVLSDFGPFGIHNPKAIVSKDDSFFARPVIMDVPIGPVDDWNETGFTKVVERTLDRT